VVRTSTRAVSGALAGLLVAAAVTLTGCAAGQVSQTANQVSGVDGGSGNAGAIGIRNALFATPSQGLYPKGSDAPVLLWLTNSGTTSDTLASVSSTAASSVTIGGKAMILPQSRMEISASTPVTLTVKGLTNDLRFGTSIPLTFSFATAGTVTINVPIEIPPERTDINRNTVDIHPQEVPNLWQSGTETVTGTPTNLTSPSVAPTTSAAQTAASPTSSG
jgi:copper(I)-binding protein